MAHHQHSSVPELLVFGIFGTPNFQQNIFPWFRTSLVGGFNPFEKVKLDCFPKGSGVKNRKYLKPSPCSC